MSFLLLLFYLFCTFIRPQEWWAPMYGWRIVNTLAIATAFCLFIERMGGKGKGGLLIKVPQNWLMLGMFASILMSHIMHTYIEMLIVAWNTFLINFLLYFIMLNGVNTTRKFKIVQWWIILMILIIVIQGMYQIQHGFGWAGQPLTYDWLRDEFRINWIGIFNDPNDLALLFMIAVGMFLAFMFGRATVIQRILSTVALGYLFYGTYLTNSRGGMMAMMATVVFYFIKRTKRFMLGGIIGGVLVLGILALGPSRMGLISTDEESANTRVQLWYDGILFAKGDPLFGIGFSMFNEMSFNMQTAHNSYILALAETGLIGLFFWTALIYISFKGLTLVQEHDPELRTYALGLQSGLMGFCVAAFFLSRNYIVLPYLLFAMSGSLVHIAQQRHPNLVFKFTRKDFRNTCLLAAGIIGIAYVIIKRTL